MAYNKTLWQNNSLPAINEGNLNKIEQGIYEAHEKADTIGNLTDLDTNDKSSIVNAINEVNKNNIYSTEEQRVGTWVNGKPLYRKTFYFNDTIGGTNPVTTIPHNLQNLNIYFVDISHSFIFNTSGSRSISFSVLAYNTNLNDRIALEVDKTNIIFTCDTGWGNLWTKVVTLLYTKTTD